MIAAPLTGKETALITVLSEIPTIKTEMALLLIGIPVFFIITRKSSINKTATATLSESTPVKKAASIKVNKITNGLPWVNFLVSKKLTIHSPNPSADTYAVKINRPNNIMAV